ncbi:DUF5343 domain-containing protein [Sinimarinibacterium flocculans]|uniref:DUF5343 domain-containing protein n=1 Tax=Sinimarinibacterium flocculans TaxID=985250 RepID=UPI003518993C
MALTDCYVQNQTGLAELFGQIRQGQAPDQFTVQHLKDLGFTSSNHRLFLPLLKALGFLSADGRPTQRYHDYRGDEDTAKRVMGEALREAYADLFVLRAKPTEGDKALFEGKFKSAHNSTERMAKLMNATFFSLLPLANLDGVSPSTHVQPPPKVDPVLTTDPPKVDPPPKVDQQRLDNRAAASLHYNIQIHLLATKDIEVYNAIFRSLKEHLVE